MTRSKQQARKGKSKNDQDEATCVPPPQSTMVAEPTEGNNEIVEGNGANKSWNEWDYRKKRSKHRQKNEVRPEQFYHPKNAVLCLNEVYPDLEYITEQEEAKDGKPICISVKVNGDLYRGYGSMVTLAKEAAAEAALGNIAKKPVISAYQTDEERDNLPWSALTSLAMYKLFKSWMENNHELPLAPPASPVVERYQAVMAYLETSSTAKKMPVQEVRGRKRSYSEMANLLPATQLPDNASTMHPLVLMNKMLPGGLVYTIQPTEITQQKVVHMTTIIEDQTFHSEGPNTKKAKIGLSKDILKFFYNVEFTSMEVKSTPEDVSTPTDVQSMI